MLFKKKKVTPPVFQKILGKWRWLDAPTTLSSKVLQVLDKQVPLWGPGRWILLGNQQERDHVTLEVPVLPGAGWDEAEAKSKSIPNPRNLHTAYVWN